MIFVDDMLISATIGRVRSRWSHLTADTPEELHEFAERLGLKREWFQTCKRRCAPEDQPCQHWHYDVTETKRKRALGMGARSITYRQMGELVTARKQGIEWRPA